VSAGCPPLNIGACGCMSQPPAFSRQAAIGGHRPGMAGCVPSPIERDSGARGRAIASLLAAQKQRAHCRQAGSAQPGGGVVGAAGNLGHRASSRQVIDKMSCMLEMERGYHFHSAPPGRGNHEPTTHACCCAVVRGGGRPDQAQGIVQCRWRAHRAAAALMRAVAVGGTGAVPADACPRDKRPGPGPGLPGRRRLLPPGLQLLAARDREAKCS